MKAVIFNATPKTRESASSVIARELADMLNGYGVVTDTVTVRTPEMPPDIADTATEAWIFIFPLYADALPSHLVSVLRQMEKTGTAKPVRVYGIVNCGFYEGRQNRLALDILKHWCGRAGHSYCGGIGIGSGGMYQDIRDVPPGKGPKKTAGKVLAGFAETIARGKETENIFTQMDFPRFLYKLMAETGWKIQIRRNGLKIKDLNRRL